MVLLFALAASANTPADVLPSERRNASSHVEARVTHAVVQQPSMFRPGESVPWSPNLGVAVAVGGGLRWLRGELGLHAAATKVLRSATETRFEPRAGLWIGGNRPFTTLGVGRSFDTGGAAWVGLASVGWVFPIDGVRVIVAADGRFSHDQRTYTLTPQPDPWDEPLARSGPSRRPGGTGVGLSVGAQRRWGGVRR